MWQFMTDVRKGEDEKVRPKMVSWEGISLEFMSFSFLIIRHIGCRLE